MYVAVATSSLAMLTLVALIFVVGRWAHQVHGLVSGFWIIGCVAWSKVIGLTTPLATRSIIDDFLVNGSGDWTIGEFQATTSYMATFFGILGKLLLSTLLCAELIKVLSSQGERLGGVVCWLRDLQPRRNLLGGLAIGAFSIQPIAIRATLLYLGSTAG